MANERRRVEARPERYESPEFADCFAEYGMVTDPSGRYTALYRPNHLIGLELSISVLAAALHNQPTGRPRELLADVATTAKRGLAAGDVLDGEGGYTVFGKLTPAATTLDGAALPIGLSHRAVMRNPVRAGDPVGWADVDLPEESLALRLRRELQGGVRP
ncbi:MAG: SAF domain-containing protein [Streptosporangiales bacterium]